MESSKKNIMRERLVQLRAEKGWTQFDLGDRMFLSQKAISSIEKGNCTLSNLILLADLYKVSLDYITGRSAKRRFNFLGLDEITVDIIEQLNSFSTSEKKKILKHLELAIALKPDETTE